MRKAVLAGVLCSSLLLGQDTDAALVEAYWAWEKTAAPFASEDDAYRRYGEKLKRDGLSAAAVEAVIQRVKRESARQEGEFYDGVYRKGPKINFGPNRLLMEAVKGRNPGKALDVAMGQGRNSIYLAKQGWNVTGFDASAVGLEQAREGAKKADVNIEAIHSSDHDFDFGREKWDLIAILYALEKRSVLRVRDALKPGGLVVVESGHKKASGAPFEYDTNELRDIFKGFEILKYEEVIDQADWDGRNPLVRIIARKR